MTTNMDDIDMDIAIEEVMESESFQMMLQHDANQYLAIDNANLNYLIGNYEDDRLLEEGLEEEEEIELERYIQQVKDDAIEREQEIVEYRRQIDANLLRLGVERIISDQQLLQAVEAYGYRSHEMDVEEEELRDELLICDALDMQLEYEYASSAYLG